MKKVVFYLSCLAAILGLTKAGYHFIADGQSIVLSGYFQVSLLFIVLAAITEKSIKNEGQ